MSGAKTLLLRRRAEELGLFCSGCGEWLWAEFRLYSDGSWTSTDAYDRDRGADPSSPLGRKLRSGNLPAEETEQGIVFCREGRMRPEKLEQLKALLPALLQADEGSEGRCGWLPPELNIYGPEGELLRSLRRSEDNCPEVRAVTELLYSAENE